MATYEIKLDTCKQAMPSTVTARKGDSGSCVISATVTENGAPYDFGGKAARFECVRRDGSKVRDDNVSIAGSKLTYTVPGEVLTMDGAIKCAYFAIIDGDAWKDTTDAFVIDVKQGSDGSLVPCDYVPEIDRLIAAWKAQNSAALDQEAARQASFDASQEAMSEDHANRQAAQRTEFDAAQEARTEDFGESEAKRDEAQGANDAAQAKNNADQLNNNLMAQANRYVKLSGDQYDHGTGVPTIDGPQQGITYLVPSARKGTLNNYDGWAWLLDEAGDGAWELIGPANPTPDTVTTEDIDNAIGGAPSSGMRYMALNAVNYLAAKLKTLFAPLSHKHGDADITGLTGAKLAAASVSRDKLDASLAQDIADLETAWDSVSQAVEEVVINPGGLYGNCVVALVNRRARHVTVLVNAAEVTPGAVYSGVTLGTVEPAPPRSVIAALSVDKGVLANLAVTAAGAVVLTRRQDVTATVAAYGSLSYDY